VVCDWFELGMVVETRLLSLESEIRDFGEKEERRNIRFEDSMDGVGEKKE